MDERALVTYPTWERYSILSHAIVNLTVRERRHLFLMIRQFSRPDPDIFFPQYGFCLSEFATWHVLGDARRPRARRAQPPGEDGADLPRTTEA